MSKNNESPLIVYTPGFFNAVVGEAIPVEVRFFQPGLPAQDVAETTQPLYTPQNLPLSAREAKLCLQELLDFGDTHAHELQERALRDDFTPEKIGGAELSRSEDKDLKSFAATGQVPPQAPEPDPAARERKRLVAAQKILLMGYSLENSIREVASLIKATQKAHDALTDAIGGKRVPFNIGSTDDMPRPDWSRVFSAMLPFVPDDAVFYTENEEMQTLLRDDQESLKALTEEESARLFPVSSKKGWKFASGKIKREPFSGQDGAVTVIVPTERGA